MQNKEEKVLYARLQTSAYVLGVGDLGLVLPPQSKTLDNLTMFSKNNALYVYFTYRGIKKSLKIPETNTVIMDLAIEEPTSTPKAQQAA